MILVDADVSEEWDSRTDWPALAERSVRAAIAHSRYPQLVDGEAEVSVKFTSNEEVRALNAQWRGKDKATNVLSFPMAEETALGTPAGAMLGDVVLAHGVCAAEAAEKAVPVEHHASHLVVHGTLHLLGYDHETSEADADLMEETERQALASVGIADPYEVTEVNT
ncbi:rRNA maturation RNase YbeY [Sphingosinicella sp. CPCC 101087]|uniref:rRNA maturation RNase YbeY n=1 Tax=Sphingosinicella sp. CPCC 101087 TaxID=2497754 RepID=UPI00101DD92C|nr:rRNA maturation RNase YbeY [Sphingosinicella sp. CPCC 101087]